MKKYIHSLFPIVPFSPIPFPTTTVPPKIQTVFALRYSESIQFSFAGSMNAIFFQVTVHIIYWNCTVKKSEVNSIPDC